MPALTDKELNVLSGTLSELMPLIELITANYNEEFIDINIVLHEAITDIEELFDDPNLKEIISKWEEHT